MIGEVNKRKILTITTTAKCFRCTKKFKFLGNNVALLYLNLQRDTV